MSEKPESSAAEASPGTLGLPSLSLDWWAVIVALLLVLVVSINIFGPIGW